jgi:hypothetical protein
MFFQSIDPLFALSLLKKAKDAAAIGARKSLDCFQRPQKQKPLYIYGFCFFYYQTFLNEF